MQGIDIKKWAKIAHKIAIIYNLLIVMILFILGARFRLFDFCHI